MSTATGHDTLTVLNGPEDGTEFALTNRAFSIGAENQCAVNIRLDRLVREVHARAEVISEGYRLRSARGAKLFVNGQAVGAIRSRVAKHGDILRAGGTELVLSCRAEGLAGRSRGLRRQSDWLWTLRETWRVGSYAVRSVMGVMRGSVRFARRHVLLCTAIAILIAYVMLPEFRAWGNSFLVRARDLGLF